MKKKLLTIALAVVMAFTCSAPISGEIFAADSSSATYTGTFPTLQNAIDKQARTLAWPYGTPSSKYAYKGGSPTSQFKEAIASAYGDRKGWGAAPKAGASCDVFVGTVVRSCGYDTSMPRGLGDQVPYLQKSSKFTKLSVSKVSDFEPGDIIIYKNSNGTGHVNIYVELGGVGYFAEAHYGKYYGSLYRKAKNQSPSSHASYGVYRANSECIASYSRGDNSEQIEYLQNFLNWAGFDCGTADGGYGPKTEAAVKAFQKAAGLNPDGKFGSESLEAAKVYQKGQTSETVVKQVYTGKYPTGTVSKKKGSKNNIKLWQAYLKWYGYPMTTGGKFGSSTVKYTKAFQKATGLKADGVVGKLTLAKAKTIKK